MRRTRSHSPRTAPATATLAAVMTAVSAQAGLANYFEDFESLNPASPSALGDAGWRVFANVFSDAAKTNQIYGYGVFPAPNSSGGFSNVTSVPFDTVPDGQQGLVTFSDYNNTDHGNGFTIETNVFQEFTIDPADVGTRWEFSFLAADGDLVAPSSALGFIKTLDPNNGFALTNFLTVDTTVLGPGNTLFKVPIDIDGSLSGQLLQIGFLTDATNFNASGVNYDNVAFRLVPSPSAVMGGLSLMAIAARRRRI